MKFRGSEVTRIGFGCLNNQGARNYQEDSFGFSSMDKNEVKEHGFTAVVADGMGGLSGGAQISGYFVASMLEMQRNRDPRVPVHIHLTQAVRTVNNSVLSSRMKGGTTAAVVMCLPAGVYWCTAGDSRVYLARDGSLTALNEDSDYFNRLLEGVISGEMTYEDASGDIKKDALKQYIGYKGGINPDVNSKPLTPRDKDKILICSDGVYNALSAAELLSALTAPASEAAGLIENKVLSKGYRDQDNFTAIVLEFIG
ncbi:MAG: serine/threonine-protein phosphatase [Bacteroides sp.]|nr:serine/threonine-protein phosphatase [Bacteroides sp.]